MRETWRWFGPADPIGLDQLAQLRLDGVVTALHHIPPGQPWSEADIAARKAELAGVGLRWEVAESLPVSETIKTQGAELRAHLDAYALSLENLARAGIEVVCYNFMPVLDWTRTELRSPLADGSRTMRFDLVDMAAFDLRLLARPEAREDYGPAIVEAADARFAEMDEQAKAALIDHVVAGLPGANDNWTLEEVRGFLDVYRPIDADRLRRNLIDFLAEVAPIAERLGVRLCCHPDDPPFSLLGLPRVMSKASDYAAVMEAVDLRANGVTLCTGSLGATAAFDFPAFIERWGARIHFAHLRNTRREPESDRERCSFYESGHLDGDTDMIAVLEALCVEERRRAKTGEPEIPMRPDHGLEKLSDLGADLAPGYPLVGRLEGMAELRGAIAAIERGLDG